MGVACAIEIADEREKRRHRRLPALRNAQLRSPQMGLVGGSILDLSESGCRIATQGFYQIGTRVCLRIEGLHSLWGKVTWQAGTEIGIEFEQKLHPAVVEHIARVTPH